MKKGNNIGVRPRFVEVSYTNAADGVAGNADFTVNFVDQYNSLLIN